jgi:hypothetical protein
MKTAVNQVSHPAPPTGLQHCLPLDIRTVVASTLNDPLAVSPPIFRSFGH